eukprot:scaffold172720_cov18-Tisochrysis_lutea.AAC.1
MIAIHSRVMTHLYPYRALVCGKDGAAHALTSKEDARPLWEGKHAQPLEMRHRKATLCQGTVPCEEPDMIVGIGWLHTMAHWWKPTGEVGKLWNVSAVVIKSM